MSAIFCAGRVKLHHEAWRSTYVIQPQSYTQRLVLQGQMANEVERGVREHKARLAQASAALSDRRVS